MCPARLPSRRIEASQDIQQMVSAQPNTFWDFEYTLTKRRKLMNSFVKPVTKRGLMAIAIAALATLLAPTAKASCGSADAARRVFANKPWSALRPALTPSSAEGGA